MSIALGILTLVMTIGAVVFFLSGNWKKTLVVVGGWGAYEAFCILYDYLLWPIVQSKLGGISVIPLTIGAMALNFLMLKWYQESGQSWLGVDYLEQVKVKGDKWAERFYQHKSGLVRAFMYVPAKSLQAVIWLLKKNDVLAFLFLSVWKDSFVTTAFLRHGRSGKLEARDYKVFIASTILSCLAWGLLVKAFLLLFTVICGLI